MQNLNLCSDMKKYYDEIFNKIGIEIPLDGNKLIKESNLKEERELVILVNQSFFNSMNSILQIEQVYESLLNDRILEEEYSNELNSCPSYLYKNPLVCDIENSDLKIHLTTCIDDDERFGVIGVLNVRLMNMEKCLLDIGPITDLKVLKQGIPFSFNNHYCSGFLTEDGREYLSNLNHCYRIQFK